MITKLFRNDFILKKEDYKNIEQYFKEDIDDIDINYEHNLKGYRWSIRMYSNQKRNLTIDGKVLRCLSINIKFFDLFGNMRNEDNEDCYKLNQIFFSRGLQSTINFKGTKEDILFSYKFKNDEDVKDIDYFLNKKEYVVGKALKHNISSFYDIDFNNEIELFATLYSFVVNYRQRHDLYIKVLRGKNLNDTEKFNKEGLDFLKEKLEYFGYDYSYKSDNRKIAKNVINKSVGNYEDVFKYFMYTTLHILRGDCDYDDFKEPVLPLEQLDVLYNFYYDNLKSYKTIS